MNSISWFIYWGNAFDNLRTVVGPIAFFTFIALLTATVGRVAVFVGARCKDEGCIEFRPTMNSLLVLAVCLWLPSAALYVAVPEKNTVYAIAASQVAERVAETDAVKGIASDAAKALQAWIGKQLKQ